MGRRAPPACDFVRSKCKPASAWRRAGVGSTGGACPSRAFMTRKRTGDPWMPSPQYAKLLTGLSVNLLVRDVAASLPFYTEVLGLNCPYNDPDFAALEGGTGVRITLHADHTYDHQAPETARLAALGKRGTGAEIRIMGLDPDHIEERARRRGFTVNVPAQDFPHGWRECRLEDSNGYMFAVGVVKTQA